VPYGVGAIEGRTAEAGALPVLEAGVENRTPG
jgi:hypothetical protein